MANAIVWSSTCESIVFCKTRVCRDVSAFDCSCRFATVDWPGMESEGERASRFILCSVSAWWRLMQGGNSEDCWTDWCGAATSVWMEGSGVSGAGIATSSRLRWCRSIRTWKVECKTKLTFVCFRSGFGSGVVDPCSSKVAVELEHPWRVTLHRAHHPTVGPVQMMPAVLQAIHACIGYAMRAFWSLDPS